MERHLLGDHALQCLKSKVEKIGYKIRAKEIYANMN